LEIEGPQSESVRVPGSHLGLGFNPLALYVIADRLAQRHLETLSWSEIPSQLPPVRPVVEIAQETAQGTGGEITRQEAGQEKHRMAVAGLQPPQPPTQGQSRQQLAGGATLEQQQQLRRRRQVARACRFGGLRG
jgi:hypothetical protein